MVVLQSCDAHRTEFTVSDYLRVERVYITDALVGSYCLFFALQGLTSQVLIYYLDLDFVVIVSYVLTGGILRMMVGRFMRTS